MQEQIATELINLAKRDLAVRDELLKANKLEGGYNIDMEKVHRENAARLREIVGLIGWPTISKVGAEASDAAWLIVQHSIGEPSFMKSCYRLMLASVQDVNPQNVAYLHDRICYFEGKPQKYGTQFDGELLYPVEDANEVNELRKKINLKPHAMETIRGIDVSHRGKDLHEDPAFNEWRRSTGWI